VADAPVPAGREDDHARHDPEVIASLLDRGLSDDDRAFGTARLADCPPCAELHADLLALAAVNLALPAPVRRRDFTLTADTAAALAPGVAGEPGRVGARLTGEMKDSESPHAAHDRLIVANLVDRSVSDDERARAEAQLAACRDCALLYDDLVALSAATRTLPVPARSRDFTLTPADAERLRVRGWRRVLAAFGSSRDALSRPLALGLTTLGLAGLLVATVPSAFSGMSGATSLSTVGSAVDDASGAAGANPEMLSQASAAPPEVYGGSAAAAAPSAAAPAGAAPAPEASPGPEGEEPQDVNKVFVGGETSPLPGEAESRNSYGFDFPGDEAVTPSTTFVVAALLLLVGLGLFALRWMARRLGDG
jgi:anti-sigma factor RsiW